jgi:hypothetical protein
MIRKLLAALALAAALLLGFGAAPAQAAPTALSLYSGTGYSGQLQDLVVGTGCVHPNEALIDNAESVYNRHGITLRMYRADNCTGAYMTIFAGQKFPNLNSLGYGNTIASVRRN